MKVLEVYPNYCWSFQSESAQAIERMREAVHLPSEDERLNQLASITDGHAFLFTGDPVNLDFAADFFDEVNVNYNASPVKNALLRNRVKRWVSPAGSIHFGDSEPRQRERYIPLQARLFRLGAGRLAAWRTAGKPA